ncbi:YegS/Rv2252/BmrU family lipid kinase [Gallibacter intestinalis]|uniref:YegS/Rv2252/BmrU family lipid kinase n=1 Tax=Gallibacter intestinalis TaxID=2779356 RepID=A0ABR9QWD7_9FIRM|nr:YegS/Rv2252/BmrU family lipid kinase [Gallibacter intestinalis]MBE5035196.1 YegS/Rv2252/BmrU family lipid kinase [Gallibacter intestinalis]
MSVEKRQKVLLFYNPHSGNGMFKNNLDGIIDRFQESGFQVVPVRAAKGTAIQRALAEMDQSMYRQIVVAGGDGTINICVNAMIRNNIDLPLAIFPTGTANDFASYFALPKDIESMVDVAMGDKYTYADVGKCNDRYFINVAAMGSLVDVSQKTDPNLKNTLGVVAYYLKGASEVVKLRALPVKLTTDDKVIEEEMYFMLVMNGMSAGGFKKLSPTSDIQDGKLNVILFRKMPIIELVPLLFGVISGNYLENKNILTFETDNLVIESEEDISTDVDGEHGEKLPLHFSVLEKKLRIFTEKGNQL